MKGRKLIGFLLAFILLFTSILPSGNGLVKAQDIDASSKEISSEEIDVSALKEEKSEDSREKKIIKSQEKKLENKSKERTLKVDESSEVSKSIEETLSDKSKFLPLGDSGEQHITLVSYIFRMIVLRPIMATISLKFIIK